MGQRLAVVVVGLALVLGAVVAVAAAQTFEEALQDPAELCPPAEDELCDEEWDDPWDDLCDELVLLGRGVVVNVLRPAPDVPLYVPKRKDDNGAGALLTARGWPEDPDATYSWTCNTGWTGTGEAATPDYFCTTAPESDVAKVTYTHPEKGSATNDSGPIHVIDAELTLAGVPDAEEESPGGMLIVDGPRRHLAIALSPEDPNTILPFGDPSEPSEHDWWTAKLQGGDEVAFYDAETEGNQLTQDDLTWGWEDEGGEQYYEHDGPSEVWVEAVQTGECSIRLTFSFDMFWFYPNPGSATAEDTVKVACVAEPPYTFLLLESVSFSGERYRAVEKDDGTLTYTAPHWLDEDEDGVPDRVYPAAYAAVPVQGGEPARMEVAATVIARPPEAFTPCRIAGVGGGFEFVGSASAQGDVLSLAPTAASKGLDEYKVDLLDKLVIDWSVSVDGGAWMQAGTSANRVYVTWQLPTASPLFETLLWISCNGADGLGGADAAAHAPGIVTAIWGEFTDGDNGPSNVVRVDGEPMTYWGKWPPTDPNGSAAAMLADEDGDGSCVAWSQLLFGCLQAQGFAPKPDGDPGPLEILEICKIVVDTIKHPGAAGFLVKDWGFSETPTYPGDPWPYVLGVTAWDLEGIPGQGEGNPKSHHANHYVCRIASRLYDPSYGKGSFGTEQEHENAAIDGIAAVINNVGRGKIQSTQEQDLVYTRAANKETLGVPPG